MHRLILATVALLFAAPLQAQPYVDIFMGSYARSGGFHPHWYYAAGARLGYAPIEAQYMHATMRAEGVSYEFGNTSFDLNSLRVGVRLGPSWGKWHPFVASNVGYDAWREWLAGEGNFDYHGGPGYSAGGGILYIPGEKLGARLDVRKEWSEILDGWSITLAAEFIP